jgi:methyl-accepting chemotaxis protein
MSRNSKVTSKQVATLAAETLQSNSTSHTAKRLAASALSQRDSAKQTGAEMESLASKVLQSEKFAESTKVLAASVLAQANKER